MSYGAQSAGRRLVVRRRGKDVAAIVPLEDLATLEEVEDRIDAEDLPPDMREDCDTDLTT